MNQYLHEIEVVNRPFTCDYNTHIFGKNIEVPVPHVFLNTFRKTLKSLDVPHTFFSIFENREKISRFQFRLIFYIVFDKPGSDLHISIYKFLLLRKIWFKLV